MFSLLAAVLSDDKCHLLECTLLEAAAIHETLLIARIA